jgi:hypothetical protein
MAALFSVSRRVTLIPNPITKLYASTNRISHNSVTDLPVMDINWSSFVKIVVNIVLSELCNSSSHQYQCGRHTKLTCEQE